MERREILESGLCPAGSKEKEYGSTTLHVEDMIKEYERCIQSGDKTGMKKLRERAMRYAEQGNAKGFYALAKFSEADRGNKHHTMGFLKQGLKLGSISSARMMKEVMEKETLVKRDTMVLKKTTEVLANEGDLRSLYESSCAYAGIPMAFCSRHDDKAAYEGFKRYLQLKPRLDMNNKEDRTAVYYCYLTGAGIGIDLEKEKPPVSWQILLENEGVYWKEAMELPGKILLGQKKYEAAVQFYLDRNTEEAVEELFSIYKSEYFVMHPELRKKLDVALLKKAEDETVSEQIRGNIYYWYAQRYNKGELCEGDLASSYGYYLRAGYLGRNTDMEQRAMEGNASRATKIVFFKQVLELGYYEVCKHLGDLYMKKQEYEEALPCYELGMEKLRNRKAKKECQEAYAACRKSYNKRQIEIEEGRLHYLRCIEGGLALKKTSFESLKALADNGNLYACLKVAELAESDTYIKANVPAAPKKDDLVKYYKRAAEGGIPDAIGKMVEIYEKGLFGQKQSDYQCRLWKERL